jgi:1-acyl-sn-glycerol-3-phosphate acyltransferase
MLNEAKGSRPAETDLEISELDSGQSVELLPPLPHSRFAMEQLSRIFISETNVAGEENIDEARVWKMYKLPIVFVPNHLSNADGPTLLSALRKVKFTKNNPNDEPVYAIGRRLTEDKLLNGIGLTRFAPTIPVWPPTMKPQSFEEVAEAKLMKKASVEEAGEALKKGKQLVIFAEGTRSRIVALAKGTPGVADFFTVAQQWGDSFYPPQPDTLIVPVSMFGTEAIHPIDHKFPTRRGPVTVNFGQPFRASELQEQYGDLPNGLRNQSMVDHVMIEVARNLPEHMRGHYAQRAA